MHREMFEVPVRKIHLENISNNLMIISLELLERVYIELILNLISMTNGGGNNPIQATVDPGICRFITRISATFDGEKVECEILSDCSCVEELAEEIDAMGPFECLTMPYAENEIYKRAGVLLKHSTCPVPMAILKCMEVASGLAIPRDVKIEFEC